MFTKIIKCILYYGLLSQLFVTQCDTCVASRKNVERCEKYIVLWGFMYTIPNQS